MTHIATKTYLVGVIERAITYYKVEANDAQTAAENWADGEFWDRDDVALEAEGPCNVREEQPDGTLRTLARSQWEDATAAGSDARQPYSVLLLYPDYLNDSGMETYYAWVEAVEPIEAVALAQQEAVAAQENKDYDPEDFAVLLVTAGHHTSQSLFNK